MRRTVSIAAFLLLFGIFGRLPTLAAPTQCPCTDPAKFTTVIEHTAHGSDLTLTQSSFEVDTESLIELKFDTSMIVPKQLLLRVEASVLHNHDSTLIEIDSYAKKKQTASGNLADTEAETKKSSLANADTETVDATTTSAATTFEFDRKSLPAANRAVPSATINLRALALAEGDSIVIKVVNDYTKEAVTYVLEARQLGFHINTSDSVMFIRRIGVSKADLAQGIAEVNFAPAAGVTYGGIWIPRAANGKGFWRFLSPGIGLNVAFMDWKDPAFDTSTGQFAQGTKSSDINVGMGLQGSLFNGVLQVTYGWNLQADKRRNYWGLGVSFVDLSKEIGSLLPKKSGS
jgi:hypothetical protein